MKQLLEFAHHRLKFLFAVRIESRYLVQQILPVLLLLEVEFNRGLSLHQPINQLFVFHLDLLIFLDFNRVYHLWSTWLKTLQRFITLDDMQVSVRNVRESCLQHCIASIHPFVIRRLFIIEFAFAGLIHLTATLNAIWLYGIVIFSLCTQIVLFKVWFATLDIFPVELVVVERLSIISLYESFHLIN